MRTDRPFSWEWECTDNCHLVGWPVQVAEETHLYLVGPREQVLEAGIRLQNLVGGEVEVHCIYTE